MTNQTTTQESPLENPMQSLMERPPRSSALTGFKGGLLAVFMLLVGIFAQQLPLRAESPARNNPLKVLFVGYGANVGRESNLILNDRQIALAKNRTAEFKALLEKEFKVTVVSREDYKPDMSKTHDVTVFDARPPVLEVVRRSLYSQKDPLTLKKYLPDDFSSPAIFVGAAGDDMYITRKTKFQRCCICLGGHALNIRKEHPIFNTPHKVRLTLAMQHTPTGIHHYASGKDMGDKIEMWPVQTESYLHHNGYFTGEVLNGSGFEDSPDCEFISGGESDKDIGAMAIGRNGNMLHWGFAASPAFMTEEAKTVFINAIHYIKRFEGQMPFVDFLACARRDEVDHQITGGYFPRAIKDRFLGDLKQCGRFYLENFDYLYAVGMVDLFLDEEAKSIGIPNHDQRILEKAVELLKEDPNDKKAMTVLKRYTTHDFKTAEEWRKWYDTNKGNLFFTEVGGYKFMEKPAPGNRPQATDAEKYQAPVRPPVLPSSGSNP